MKLPGIRGMIQKRNSLEDNMEKYHQEYGFDTQTPLLTAILAADLHTDGNYNRDRNVKLRAAFDAISLCRSPIDAFIGAGDITNSGHISEYTHLKTFIQEHLRVDKFLPQMGNHDARGCSIYPFFDEATELFQDFCRFCGIEPQHDSNFWHTTVKGYHFIALATERLPHDEAYITAAQADWFIHCLKEAIDDEKPVFVINHQPPIHRNGWEEDMLLDEGGSRLVDIMESFASEKVPILYISGHLHVLNEQTLESEKNVYYLNLPSLLYGPTEDESGAYAFVMEVTENQILLRCRDFEFGRWIEDQHYIIPIG